MRGLLARNVQLLGTETLETPTIPTLPLNQRPLADPLDQVLCSDPIDAQPLLSDLRTPARVQPMMWMCTGAKRNV